MNLQARPSLLVGSLMARSSLSLTEKAAPPPGPVPIDVTAVPIPIRATLTNLGGGWWRVFSGWYEDDGTARFMLPALITGRTYRVEVSCRAISNAWGWSSDLADVEVGMLEKTVTGTFTYEAVYNTIHRFVDVSVVLDEDEYDGAIEINTPKVWLLP